jgi:hypothetical protein
MKPGNRDESRLVDFNKAEEEKRMQDRMLEDDESLEGRKKAAREEMLSQMPDLPHEIEIEEELKDEEELLGLYKEVGAVVT